MAKPTPAEKIPDLEVPPGLLAAIDAVARERLGRADAEGAALARRVAELSALYTRAREDIGEEDRKGLAAARLRFFLPRDLPKVMAPLSGLCRAGLLPRGRSWSVLDLGAGLGATCLGAARFARLSGLADAISVVAVDPWERGLALLEELVQRLAGDELAKITLRSRTGTMEGSLPDGPYDLILLGLSLNEWARDKSPDEAAALLCRLGERLSPSGSLIVIEPALHGAARFLQETRDALLEADAGLNVFAPCVSNERCPMLASERDWCHAELRGELPAALAAVARAAGLRRSRRTFAYLTLRRDGKSARDFEDDRAYRVVSESLPSKGKRELFVCGDGSVVRLRLLSRDASDRNEAFAAATRGDLISFGRSLPDEPGARLSRDDEVRVQGIVAAIEPPN